MESGSGERLPSVDTRQPRIRDSDAIIEVNNLPVDLLHVFFYERNSLTKPTLRL